MAFESTVKSSFGFIANLGSDLSHRVSIEIETDTWEDFQA